MSDSAVTGTKWSALVCPECRFVFRIPAHDERQGVVCPCCQRVLRVPHSGDQVPPLIVAAARTGEGEAKKGERVRRKRRSKPSDETWQWEEDELERSSGTRRVVVWQLMAAVVLFAVTILVISRVLKMEPAGRRPLETSPVAKVEPDPAGPSVSEPDPKPEKEDALWFKEEEVFSLIEEFLKADTVDELLPLVRDRERLEDRIRAYYRNQPLEAPGFRQAKVSMVVQEAGFKAVLVGVSMRNFEWGQLAVVGTGEGSKVDWESWVGHGEMPWERFLEEKPTNPVAMRVLLSNVNYYNRSFTDERKWKSLRLASADGEKILYGYLDLEDDDVVKKFSDLIGSLEGGEGLAVLEISFPENAETSRQVRIHDLVAKDWLMPDQNDE